jgi:hypothetical protein
MKSNYILKIYMHPKVESGFQILKDSDWSIEVKAERELDWSKGCSSMSQHDSRIEAIQEAKKHLGAKFIEGAL